MQTIRIPVADKTYHELRAVAERGGYRQGRLYTWAFELGARVLLKELSEAPQATSQLLGLTTGPGHVVKSFKTSPADGTAEGSTSE